MSNTADPRESHQQKLDLLCRQLVAANSYAILGIMDGADDDSVQLYGVEIDDDFEPTIAVIPELYPLTEHFDRILVRTDGYAFEIICIKSRLGGAKDEPLLPIDQLRQIGRECLQYTGNLNGVQMAVQIQVWEVTEGVLNPMVGHLEHTRSAPGLKQKVGVTAWSLDLSTRSVWTNARFYGRLSGRRLIQKTLEAIAQPIAPGAERSAELGTDMRYPVLTYGLVALICLFFILQLKFGSSAGLATPTVASLIALGGLQQSAVLDAGQWYRLFTAGFLHADLLHLGLNGFALFMGGSLLESWLGRAWLLSVFSLSMLGGSIASLLFNDPGAVSVGASGAILGMLATAFLVALRLPYGSKRTSTLVSLMYWLVPALIPLATHQAGGATDFAGHFGGAIVGFVIGGALLKAWKSSAPVPPFRRLSVAVAGLCGMLLCMSMAQAISNRGIVEAQLSLSEHLLDNTIINRLRKLSYEQLKEPLSDAEQRYPRSPRLRYFSATYALANQDLERAKEHLHRGLAEREILQAFFGSGELEAALHILLAEVLLRQHDETAARVALKPACGHFADEDVARFDASWVQDVCTP